MAQIQFYPASAAITSYFAANGVEVIDEGATDFVDDFNHLIWNVVKQTEAARALTVYGVSANAINVVGDDYGWRGETKAYSPGAAIDLSSGFADATVLVWMRADNTVGHGDASDGWPSEDHIKLAEVDVDSSNEISDIRDCRMMVGLQWSPDEIVVDADGAVVTNLGEIVWI